MARPLHPHAAGRWGPGGCPASAMMEQLYPDDTESPARRAGDAFGFYVQHVLDEKLVTPHVGDLAPNGEPITQEMVDCAAEVIRDVQDTVRTWGGVPRIEEPLDATMLIHPDNKGRPDVYLLNEQARKLHLWELKFGHRYVDAYMNWQCVDYLAMIMECNAIPQADWPHWTITVTVAQPRNYHPDGTLREWHFTGAELVELVGRLATAATLAQAERPAYMTGDYCRDCSGRHACAALERVSMRLVDMAYTGQPVDLPPAALGLELRIIRDAIKRLGARAEGLEEHALALAKRGTDIPHWRTEYSMGRERWRDDVPVEDVIMLGEIYGVDLRQPVKAITPTQARKAGVDPAAIEGFAHKPRGAMTLVPFDDRDVAKRFG